MGGTLRPEVVEPLLRGSLGRPYVWREQCPSTQELARPLGHGGVAACEEQTAGRGRTGQAWHSPPGLDVLCSVLLRPRTPAGRLPAFSLVAAEAVCEATLPDAVVHWPNDVMAGGRKLAGVLCELREGALVVGIGLNVNSGPGDLPPNARVEPTSMAVETGRKWCRAQVLATLLERLEARFDDFERNGFPGLARDGLRGHRVVLADGTEGAYGGVDEQGRLLLDGRPLHSAEAIGVSAC